MLAAALVVGLVADNRCEVPAVEAAPQNGTIGLTLGGEAWSGWRDMCRTLADYLALVAPFSEDAAARAQERLLAPGFFSRAKCERESADRLSCALEPQPIVRDVELSGHLPFPLLERDVRRRLFVREGALLPPDPPFPVQLERLRDFLRRQGFFGVKLGLRLDPIGDAEPNLGMRVETSVEGGQSYDLGDVDVTGDPVIDSTLAEGVVRHYWLPWTLEQRFRPGQLDEDVETLEKMLHDIGYPEARVTGDYALDPREGAVDVVLHIQSGRQLVVRFLGNSALDDDDLRKVMTFEASGVVDAIEVETARLAIVERYQEEGFYAAEVAGRLEESESRVAVVTYTVAEGPRGAIRRVKWTGNTVSGRDIRRAVDPLTRRDRWFAARVWVDTWVERDQRAIAAYYKKLGYAQAVAAITREVRKDGDLDVAVKIDEGPRRVVARLELDGVPPGVGGADLVSELPLREGAGFDPARLEEQERTLLGALGAAGYLAPRVWHEVQEVSSGGVVLVFHITPGPRSHLGGVLVRGNERTSAGLITEEIGLEPGDPLDVLQIGAAERRLRDLGIFSSVRLDRIGTPGSGGETWLLVALEERDVLSLDAVAGFTTDELFNVGMDFRDRNLFGRALQVDLELRLSNASEVISPALRIGNADRMRFHLRAPNIAGLPVNAGLSTYYDFEDEPLFQQRQIGATATIDRKLRARGECLFCPEALSTMGYDLSSTELTGKDGATAPPTTVEPTTVGRLFVELDMSRTDAFVDPRNGYTASLRVELAARALALGLDGSAFWRVVSSGSAYIPLGVPFAMRTRTGRRLGGPVVLALNASYGAAQPYAGDLHVPESETFYYGGDLSLRGFEQRASALVVPEARYLVSGKLELRWYFLDNLAIGSFQIGAFVDAAAAALQLGELSEARALGIGPVLRYVTPIGPLSIAYGWPVVRPPGIDEAQPDAAPPTGRLHVVLGQVF